MTNTTALIINNQLKPLQKLSSYIDKHAFVLNSLMQL